MADAADALSAALERWQAITSAASPGPWTTRAKHGRDISDEGWSDAVAKGEPQGAAGARGVRVVVPETGPQVHHGCGAALDPEQRRRSAVVLCGSGHRVDQDANMLELMAAAMR